jgi:hypothetical protein
MTIVRLPRLLRRFAVVASMACAVGALGVLPSVASAATIAPSAAPTDVTSWAVAPSNAAGNDKRTHFGYTDMKPGATTIDYVGVTNFSTKPVTFDVYPADGVTTADGGLGLTPSYQKSVDVGMWVRMAHNIVNVPARSRVNVPFNLTVPKDAEPGDHVGGIVASVVEVPVAGKVSREDRVGVAMYLRVAGALHPALSIEGVTTGGYDNSLNPIAGGSTTVTYTVRNTGNVRLGANLTVTITGPFGVTLATLHPKALDEVLPRQSATLKATLSGIAPALFLTAHVDVKPTPVAGADKISVAMTGGSGSSDLFAFPWPQLLLLLLVIAAGYGLRRWLLARRRHHATVLAAAVEKARKETAEELAAATTTESE